jgi:UDP-N-acetylglucosamine transferase subunit ALG13
VSSFTAYVHSQKYKNLLDHHLAIISRSLRSLLATLTLSDGRIGLRSGKVEEAAKEETAAKEDKQKLPLQEKRQQP